VTDSNSPFTGSEHPEAFLREDIKNDLRHTRRRLSHLVDRMSETVDLMGGVTGKTAFTPSDVAGLRREISRLASVVSALISAGL
jgi:hypothetical protein